MPGEHTYNSRQERIAAIQHLHLFIYHLKKTLLKILTRFDELRKQSILITSKEKTYPCEYLVVVVDTHRRRVKVSSSHILHREGGCHPADGTGSSMSTARYPPGSGTGMVSLTK